MRLAQSKLTSQGQVSVPAEVRRRLGLAPGSVLEWEAEGDQIVVRRARRFSSAEVHEVLFPEGVPEPKSLDELKEGIRQHVRRRYARR
jgi:AbrB family looped-hinge helix DNA binding protein